MPTMIDSHCHIHDDKFAPDLPEVLDRARQAGITHMITVGCDIETTKKAQNKAENYSHVYYTAGYHPHEARFFSDENYNLLKQLANHPKCVAIGECGLDFYYEHSDPDDQIRAFIKQISLAKELKLPLIIHLRDAYKQCLEILQKYLAPDQKLVIHCFSGTLEQAERFSRLGALISLSGIVTFKKPGELLLVAKNLPLTSLLIETDAPYLAPHPHRGHRNEPSYLAFTLKAVAQARGEDEKTVAQQIFDNSVKFFNIKI